MACNMSGQINDLARDLSGRNGRLMLGHVLEAEAGFASDLKAIKTVSVLRFEQMDELTDNQTEAIEMDDTDSLMQRAAKLGSSGAIARQAGDEAAAEEFYRGAFALAMFSTHIPTVLIYGKRRYVWRSMVVKWRRLGA
jgi:hypothetical protein